MMEINIPEVLAEVEQAFARYERALVTKTSRSSTRCFGAARTRCATARPKTFTAMTRSPLSAPAARPPIWRAIS